MKYLVVAAPRVGVLACGVGLSLLIRSESDKRFNAAHNRIEKMPDQPGSAE